MSSSDHPESDLDGIDPSIPAGTLEYWKARARQWQYRCQRAEREKTELIAELLRLQEVRSAKQVHDAERRAATLRGDVMPGVSRAPKAF
ncbi:hypothetical protein KEF29_03105 [Streptomyces tuirus]|uniref:Uncharacterized protein n=1 Tax=Streptomyces tuirus TaxID=68278 RepID=A0A941J0H6_9ACTN|nr:hypothetical protein [Streptomyces tuirus]